MVKACSENLEAREDFMFCSRQNFLSLFENELRCVERKDLLNNQVLILALTIRHLCSWYRAVFGESF